MFLEFIFHFSKKFFIHIFILFFNFSYIKNIKKCFGFIYFLLCPSIRGANIFGPAEGGGWGGGGLFRRIERTECHRGTLAVRSSQGALAVVLSGRYAPSRQRLIDVPGAAGSRGSLDTRVPEAHEDVVQLAQTIRFVVIKVLEQIRRAQREITEIRSLTTL